MKPLASREADSSGREHRPGFRDRQTIGIAIIGALGVIIAGFVGGTQVVQHVTVDQADMVQLRAELAKTNEAVGALREQNDQNLQILGQLRDEVRRFEQAPSSASSSTAVSPGRGETPTVRRSEPTVTTSHGFEFSSPVCRRRSIHGIDCELTITSSLSDAELSLYTVARPELAARLWDEANNSYDASWVALADRDCGLTNEVRAPLVAGVPAKAVLRFENIGSSPQLITKLDIGCWGHEPFRVAFRNVTIRG